MKRNSALIRKLRALSEESRQGVLDDIAKTNQSKVGQRAGWRGSQGAGASPAWLPAAGRCCMQRRQPAGARLHVRCLLLGGQRLHSRPDLPRPPPLPQYVSEVVGALCEAPLRLKDVPAALAVCSALHQVRGSGQVGCGQQQLQSCFAAEPSDWPSA